MERKKIVELIKLEVLSCLQEKDRETLQSLKLTNDDFPWKELAEYQHITALLPSVLEILTPASDLKDKTALKLYNIRDEIKAKLEVKKALETVAIPLEENIEIEAKAEFGEVVEVGEKVEVEERVAVAAESTNQFSGIEPTLAKDDSFKISSNFREKSETENIFQQTRGFAESVVTKHPPDKEMVEKIIKDYFNSYLVHEFESIKQSIKKNRLLGFIFFAITLILIGVIFFIK
ncbi:MAG: hypothetical protein HND39_04865 [Ignavibacteriota bacterium]|jgi:hypothetical protein|nr:MAG: hypothetical protein EDM72_11535 [Chlorobiota bacterium]MBE7475592.1 hypothetical protein [Ignavibacteriales bacterium]MBL1123098.1 hypothetical protein [Ignavibacteriota bacterium]MBV6419954.1 hypothetical protein [Ignavibacteriaceae bacterium]MCE7855689.1 hypothetical protein [Ignavibacteria bacterium CHB3]MEB2295914.1 hypothetical protein [Ignavibacteria bacterium]